MKKKATSLSLEKNNETKKEKVNFFFLWKTILILSFVLISYQLFVLFFEKNLSSSTSNLILFLGFPLELFCFGYLGFKASSVFVKKPFFAFLSGFFCGSLVNLVSLTIKFVMFSIFFVPETYSQTIAFLVSEVGINSQMASSIIGFITILTLVLGIIFAGIIGGVFTWIFFLVFRKIFEN